MGFNYLPSEYKNLVKMSSGKHLLVEGKDDKRCFEHLFDVFGISVTLARLNNSLIIDTAENLISFPDGEPIGNRDKVERIAAMINDQAYKNKFIGFVDREFRGYDFSDQNISDRIQTHFVDGRLIWSRGHSIENYCFNIDAIVGTLQDNTCAPYYREAIECFAGIFNSVICLACAAGIVGFQMSMLKDMRGILGKDEIVIEDAHSLALNASACISKLSERTGMRCEEAEQVVCDINRYQASLDNVDFNLVRWACDGHLGRKLMWEAYRLCVHEVGKRFVGEPRAHKDACQVMKQDDASRFYSISRAWAERAVRGNLEYPDPVISMLNG